MGISDNLSLSNLYSMPIRDYTYKPTFTLRMWLPFLTQLLAEGYGALQRAEQKHGKQNPMQFAMGQCKCIQTAIYKGVPKAVGGKEKQSAKNLSSDTWIRKWKTSKMYFFF